MTKYTQESLERKSRKEIQNIAKKCGLKAGKKTVELIQEILASQTPQEDKLGSDVEMEVADVEGVEVTMSEQDVQSHPCSITTQHSGIKSTPTTGHLISMDEVADIHDIRRISHRVSALEPTTLYSEDLEIGENVRLEFDNSTGVIVRVNKKSVRVMLHNSDEEITVKFNEISKIMEDETKTEMDVVQTESDEANKSIRMSIAAMVPLDIVLDASSDVDETTKEESFEGKHPQNSETETLVNDQCRNDVGPFNNSKMKEVTANVKSIFSPNISSIHRENCYNKFTQMKSTGKKVGVCKSLAVSIHIT